MPPTTNQVVQYPVNPPPPNPSMVSTNMPYSTPATGNEGPTAPPLPISDSQKQQLDVLLQQYVANQITPAQYQAARARILSGQ
jgi:hypothetical protein